MPLTNVPFGIPGPLKSITLAWSFEERRIKMCDGTYILYLDGAQTSTLERDIYNAYGIECNAGGVSEAVTGITLNESEEIAGQHKVARSPNTTPAEDRLVKTDYMMIVGLSRTLSINGMGALPTDFEDTDIGRIVGVLTFSTRYGTFDIETGTLTVLRDVSEVRQLTEFHTYTLAMEEYQDTSDSDAQDHMITLDAELEAYTETFHTRARSYAMSQDAVPTDTTTIVNFLDD